MDEKACMKLYKVGKTDAAIAKAVGVSESTVRSWRLRRGIAAHNNGRGVSHEEALPPELWPRAEVFEYMIAIAKRMSRQFDISPTINMEGIQKAHEDMCRKLGVS